MKKEIKINEKVYTINELKYKDITSVVDKEKSEAAKILMLNATGISEEEYNDLSMKDGIAIMKVVNEMNGLNDSDFQPAIQTSD